MTGLGQFAAFAALANSARQMYRVHMSTLRLKFVPIAVCLAFGLAACGDDAKSTDESVTTVADTTAATDTTAPQTSATDAPETSATDAPDTSVDDDTVKLVDTSGEYLTDSIGITLYIFTQDPVDGGTSACYDACATTWPPLVIGEGDFVVEIPEGFGEIPRDDGLSQLTYLGSPLYYYAGDTAPGDLNGDGIGGVWFAVPLTG